MKASIVALAASALLGSAAAAAVNEMRHAHAAFHDKRGGYSAANEVCETGVTTIWSTWYGEMTRESHLRQAACIPRR